MKIGNLKKKIIILLGTGIALGTSRSMSKQFEILGAAAKEWQSISRNSLKRSLLGLYSARLIDLRPKGDAFEIILSKSGKRESARFDLDNLKIKKEKWDGRWRLVMSDIPEKIKKVREALRFHFKKIGLVEYQKSVFITPFRCEREVKFICEFYQARKHVRFIVADVIDDEEKMKKEFGIR